MRVAYVIWLDQLVGGPPYLWRAPVVAVVNVPMFDVEKDASARERTCRPLLIWASS